MATRETIHCGDHIVGFVDVSSVDMWHLGGQFEPGPDFSHYEDAIIAVRALQHAAESNADVDWSAALDIVNDYGFFIASNDGASKSVRDFQLDDDGHAEFKLEL